MTNRVLVWFSCGAASAVAAKLASEKYGDELEILYCDTLAYEHPDNPRFMKDVENWIGRKIKILKSDKYKDIYEVFETGYLIGIHGAMCTRELKTKVRIKYQRPGDIHIFGFHHNNCIGCVKAYNMKYWERVKRLFPKIYTKMAKMERKVDIAINKKYVNGKRIRIFLDELTQEDFDRGRNVPEPDIECGVLCTMPEITLWDEDEQSN